MSIRALSDYTVYSRYSKYRADKKRRETWNETVDRVFDMHATRYEEHMNNDEFVELFNFAKDQVHKKSVLGSQRALQFGGAPILKHNDKMYNCATTYVDRFRAFQEIMFLLLCGCGVGFSVQKHHVKKLPTLCKSFTTTETIVIGDSIEGWADSIGQCVGMYLRDNKYTGRNIIFDYSQIRPAGALIANSFKAPGPDGLRAAHNKIIELIEKLIEDGHNRLRPIDVYDIIMHTSDAVLSGGVRRCLPSYYSVQLDNGNWKNITDLTTDDCVLFQGTSYPITNIFNNGVQRLMKIHTPNGYHISTPNHKWLVYNTKEQSPQWIETQNIKPGIHQFMQPKHK